MSDNEDWLLVSEIFESHQGEGPSTGQVAKFIRLGGCNLTCHWCDTPYTWSFTDRQAEAHFSGKKYDPQHEMRRMTFVDILSRIKPDDHPLIVITGGEPLLQSDRLLRFIELVNCGLTYRRFEIETAGTMTPIIPSRRIDVYYETVSYNVSLKLASSRNPLEKRRIPEVIRYFTTERANFKFVITRDHFEDDLREVATIVQDYRILPDQVWLMPEGTTQLDQVSGIQQLMPEALKRGYNVSSRLHVLAYGNERGI